MDQTEAPTQPGQPVPPPAPADKHNPAIIDARKTYVLTLISSVLFVGAILVFIL